MTPVDNQHHRQKLSGQSGDRIFTEKADSGTEKQDWHQEPDSAFHCICFPCISGRA